ncbi:MAG: hypothetical protein KA247_00515 [Bacteroidetes bacterium]|nr:hypothetical protein [Bacteroidota bacterium]
MKPTNHLRRSSILRFLRRSVLLTALSLFTAIPVLSWVFPEHRDILLEAIGMLDQNRQTALNRLWNEARAGHEERLMEFTVPIDSAYAKNGIDFASWSAIAGDHSCSSEEMLSTILTSDWIIDVAEITNELRSELNSAEERDERDNAMRDADIRLQRADPSYATRAASGAAHYPLSRRIPGITLEEYLKESLDHTAEINSTAIYIQHHQSAMRTAERLANEKDPAARKALILSMLADEAFGIHFLQDMFSAGHAAGTRGSASLRKGTHDYYNEFGFTTQTWGGEAIVLVGDAWMRPQDRITAAYAIKKSLEHLIDAATGKERLPSVAAPSSADTVRYELNACNLFTLGYTVNESDVKEDVTETMKLVPVPGLPEGLGEMPRFRSELGLFVGFASAARFGATSGGYGLGQNTVSSMASMEFSGRIGIGLEGVLNQSGDGVAFVAFGMRQDAASGAKVTDDPEFATYGSIFSAIPGRTALYTRIRLPFWLIPGDLLVLGPILGLLDPPLLAKVGVGAVNGGLLPLHAKISTPVGQFQFVFGRELAYYFYGYTKQQDRMFIPNPTNDDFILAAVRSVRVELPLVEYRPLRSFSTDQTSSLLLQFYVSIDHLTRLDVVAPAGGLKPETRDVVGSGFRLLFDWRHYF